MAYSMVVLVKQTPDLNAVRVDKASGKPLLGDQLVMSSADAIAVEAALQLKEAHGGEITVISAGPPSVKDVLQRALAMGADRGLLIPVDAPNALDTLAMAKVIAGSLEGQSFDLMLAGQQSDDYETGQVPAQIAELLGIAQVSWVTKIEANGVELSFCGARVSLYSNCQIGVVPPVTRVVVAQDRQRLRIGLGQIARLSGIRL